MKWDIEEAGPQSAEWNMRVDQERLATLSSDSRPWLRFYAWESPSATYGYFLNPWDYFNPAGVKAHSLQLARRPTGGGIIFHTCDLAFSIGVPSSHPFYTPNTLESYAQINQRVLHALAIPGKLLASSSPQGSFCMTKPTVYDLLVDGRKVGGAAQRKTKKGILHQGSLCLTLPAPDFLKDVLKPNWPIYEEIERVSYPLAKTGADPSLLKLRLIEAFTKSPLIT